MYHPTTEQADADRKRAYETGVPHGFVAPGDKYRGLPTIQLTVVSELHGNEEYGERVDGKGRHSGGPFVIAVSPKMRVEELRKVIMVGSAASRQTFCTTRLDVQAIQARRKGRLQSACLWRGVQQHMQSRASALQRLGTACICRTREASSPRCSGCPTPGRTWRIRRGRWSSTAWHTGMPSSRNGR